MPSDDQLYPPPPIVMMTPERARDIARSLKALAEQFTDAHMPRQAARYERDAQWYLGYALVLAATQPHNDR